MASQAPPNPASPSPRSRELRRSRPARRNALWPALTLVFALWALIATAFALRGLLGSDEGDSVVEEAAPPSPPPPPREARRALRAAAFEDLPGWESDALAEALKPFVVSCGPLLRRGDEALVGPDGMAGAVGDWRAACAAAKAVPGGDDLAARQWLEAHFRPWAVLNHDDDTGLFTGYYEPTLRGNRRRGGAFQTPLYRRPGDLISLDLGRFREDLKGKRLAGRVERGALVPYAERAAIDGGALGGRGLELLWVDSAVDAFFLHIQGSGRVELAEGGFLRVGYAAQNGHPYVAVGRELVRQGEMTLEEVSMQSIRRWLEEDPRRAEELMAANPSYVFFRILKESGPVGSQGVVLTPERSLAVDRKFLPLGAPLWVDTSAPSAEAHTTEASTAEASTAEASTIEARPAGVEASDGSVAARRAADVVLRRLLIAQDTGGAIRGPVRGDIFWGPGERAAAIAGRMKHEGRLWILLPAAIDPLKSNGEEASP